MTVPYLLQNQKGSLRITVEVKFSCGGDVAFMRRPTHDVQRLDCKIATDISICCMYVVVACISPGQHCQLTLATEFTTH